MANRDRIGHTGWVCIVVSNRPGACGSVRCAGAEGTLGGMASWWRVFPRAARRYPWPINVLLYAGLFSAGDALQQRLRGGPADWRQTRRVATLALTFHGNFNYVWLRLLERALPGRAPRTVVAKVLCDQTVGGPIVLSAFYVGEGPRRRSESGIGALQTRQEAPGVGKTGDHGDRTSETTEVEAGGDNSAAREPGLERGLEAATEDWILGDLRFP